MIEVSFGEQHLEAGRYRIIELPDQKTLEAITNGAEITIRGQEDDETVMLIGEQTLRLRELCTSNTFLLINKQTGMIGENTSSVLEATHMKANLERVKKLLREFPLEGLNCREQEGLQLLHKDIFPGIVQASETEFRKALIENKAFLYKDHYRILGPTFICRFFELFFTSALIEDWSYACNVISRKAVATKYLEDFYDEFNEETINQMMTVFHDRSHYSENGDDWKLSEKLVCRFYADQLLRAKSSWFLSDLLQAWKKLVGDFQPDISMLRGLALFEENPAAGPEDYRIQHFSAEELTTNPAELFRILFQTRQRWQYEDLLAYIEQLESTESKQQALIIKFGRLSTDTSTGKKIVTPLIPI